MSQLQHDGQRPKRTPRGAQAQRRPSGAVVKIHKAQQEMATTKLSDKELLPTRDIKKLLRERVQFLPGHVGLVLSDYTTMAENLRILDWTIGLGEHVQFWIGDVLNAGHVAYGNKYAEALKRTGRAKSTLRQYASVARRIPLEKRKTTLSFWHPGTFDDWLLDSELEKCAKQNSSSGGTGSVIALRRARADHHTAFRCREILCLTRCEPT
jgi:hypothetical protein